MSQEESGSENVSVPTMRAVLDNNDALKQEIVNLLSDLMYLVKSNQEGITTRQAWIGEKSYEVPGMDPALSTVVKATVEEGIVRREKAIEMAKKNFVIQVKDKITAAQEEAVYKRLWSDFCYKTNSRIIVIFFWAIILSLAAFVVYLFAALVVFETFSSKIFVCSILGISAEVYAFDSYLSNHRARLREEAKKIVAESTKKQVKCVV